MLLFFIEVNTVNVVYETIKEWKKPTEGIMVVGGCMEGYYSIILLSLYSLTQYYMG